VTVAAKDENGAEFVGDRKTRIAKQVRAFDRYERHRDLVIKRTHGSTSTAQSTWTIHRIDADHSTLGIDALITMSRLQSLVMNPFLEAALLRHQLHTIHPRGRAPRQGAGSGQVA
jgi:hypothetical protein